MSKKMNLVPATSRLAIQEVNILSFIWWKQPELLEWDIELVQEGNLVFHIFVTQDNQDRHTFPPEETKQDKAIKQKAEEYGVPLSQWMSLVEPDIL